MSTADYSRAIFSPHALEEMARRGLPRLLVQEVLAAPMQVGVDRPGRIICQAQRQLAPDGRVYLVRVFVDVDRDPPEVVTAYRTSKIQKYWRPQP